MDEILGYHLEQATRYLEELGRPDRATALAAGERLGDAGRRAYWRGDWKAAAGLLERALTLTRPHRLDVHVEVALAQAAQDSDLHRAIAVASDAAERADGVGDEAGAALARTVVAFMRTNAGQCGADELEGRARTALPLLEAAGDDDGLASVWHALGLAANMRSRYADWAAAMEQALLHARRAGHAVVGSWMMCIGLAIGPMPAEEALAKLDGVAGDQPHPGDLIMRAGLLAMLDRTDEALAVAVPSAQRLDDLGFGSAGDVWLGEVASITGDLELAMRRFRNACDAMEANGSMATLSSYAPRLGRVLCALGRYDEAEPLAMKGRDIGAPDDILTQQVWREVLALVHSARDGHAEAERLAREAVEFGLRSDAPRLRGDVFSTLAEVLENADRPTEAAEALDQALVEYESKPIIPLARRTRARLASLQEAPAQATTENG